MNHSFEKNAPVRASQFNIYRKNVSLTCHIFFKRWCLNIVKLKGIKRSRRSVLIQCKFSSTASNILKFKARVKNQHKMQKILPLALLVGVLVATIMVWNSQIKKGSDISWRHILKILYIREMFQLTDFLCILNASSVSQNVSCIYKN